MTTSYTPKVRIGRHPGFGTARLGCSRSEEHTSGPILPPDVRMPPIVGPLLIFLGLTAFAYGIYLFAFANRDKRTSRQKNLDSIAQIRGDKKAPKKAKAAKK